MPHLAVAACILASRWVSDFGVFYLGTKVPSPSPQDVSMRWSKPSLRGTMKSYDSFVVHSKVRSILLRATNLSPVSM